MKSSLLVKSPTSVQAPKAMVVKKASKIADEDPAIHLIYKIEGKPNEVDVFKLGLLLESMGKILTDSCRITSPKESADLRVTIKPFKQGSFILDFSLHIQQGIGLLFVLSQTEEAKQIKQLLEDLGLVQKAITKGVSLFQLVKRLGQSEPAKVEKIDDETFSYHSADGTVTRVSQPVHNLYNYGTVNQFIMPALGIPLESEGVTGITTFLKSAEKVSGIKLTKEDVPWMQAYAEPEESVATPERIENTTVQLLHPKSGTYGETTGTWTFTVAGSKRTIKASILHPEFLAKYASGTVRFYSGDILKARVHEVQVIDASGESVKNEIVEVLEYRRGRTGQ